MIKKKRKDKRRKNFIVKARTYEAGKLKVKADAMKAGMSEEAYIAKCLGILEINERMRHGVK